jgi:tellurite resistance protein
MSAKHAAAGLTPDEIEVFARGLHFLATVDEMDAREEALIREFLRETGDVVRWEDLASRDFSPVEAAGVLQASYLRRIFLEAAIVLVRADGRYSDAERRALGQVADAFGLSNVEFGELEQRASGAALPGPPK